MNAFKKSRLKNKQLKKSNLILIEEKNKILIEKEDFLKKKNSLVEEKENLVKSKKSLVRKNVKLRKEIEILKPLIEKFTIGSQKLQ